MIEEHKSILSEDECHWLIQESKSRLKGNNIFHYHAGIPDVNLEDISRFLENKSRPLAEEYIKKSGGTLSSDSIYFNGFSFRHASWGYQDPLHYDPEIVCTNDKIILRAFVCLLYLNTLSDGYLILPMQNKVICPESGKIVVFPASYLFPHYVPFVTDDRYFIRLHWNLRTDRDTRLTCL